MLLFTERSIHKNWYDQHLMTDVKSRSDSSGVESASDRLPARTSTYTRRENRLTSLSKTEDDSASKDYKKVRITLINKIHTVCSLH